MGNVLTRQMYDNVSVIRGHHFQGITKMVAPMLDVMLPRNKIRKIEELREVWNSD